MGILQRYIDYLNDNPEGHWFKRKLYGWGWTPVHWQGWVVVLVYIILLLAFAFTIDENSPPRELVFTFFLPLVLLTGTLIRICYKKGEKPKWMWGLPKETNESDSPLP
jgi:hypothetical protein